MREKLNEWIKNLCSGDGDYKKIYVEDWLRLLKITNQSTPADDDLLTDLKDLARRHSFKNERFNNDVELD